MQDAKPSRSRGIGFIILCLVVLGSGLYLNAGFNNKIADLRDELDERFKALAEETTGVKPEIQTNRGALKRLEDGLISLESRVKSVSALATQMHDMLFKQAGVQKERDDNLDATLNALVETSRALQAQINALRGDAQGQQEEAAE